MIELICPMLIIVNLTGKPLSDYDFHMIKRARHHCQTSYKYSPCLKKFTKVKPLTYRAICARPLKEEE